MAQLPCIGLWWPLTKLPFGSCAIYFHHSVVYWIIWSTSNFTPKFLFQDSDIDGIWGNKEIHEDTEKKEWFASSNLKAIIV